VIKTSFGFLSREAVGIGVGPGVTPVLALAYRDGGLACPRWQYRPSESYSSHPELSAAPAE